MKQRVLIAKNEGLNWQAVLIEEAETDIKVALKNAVLRGETFEATNKRIVNIVNEAVNDIAIPSLKEHARRSLLRFATEQYRKLRNAPVRFDLNTVKIIALIAYSIRLSAKEAAQARRELSRSPTVPPGLAESIPESGGQYIEIAQPLKEYSKIYMKRVERAFNELAESSAKDEYGSRVSLRNIAEMSVRYERHVQELEELKANGVVYVWTSTHANCSKRCEPWQGKLYSLNGTSGTIDGIPFRPLEDATDIYETTKSGKTYKNGIISGFNCRHFLIPYKKGNKPIHVGAEVIEKEREINDTQRYLERGVRKYRELTEVYRGVNKKKAAHYRQLAQRWNERYIEYSKRNKVAYYPSRTSIF